MKAWGIIAVAVFSGMFGLLSMGVLVQAQDRMEITAQSKRQPIPMPSDCKGCKDAVLPRSAWASDTDE